MTHDARAREVIAQFYWEHGYALVDGAAARQLEALSRAGLRVVPAEPTEADVERVARASWDEREKLANGYKLNGNVWWDDADVPQNMRDTYRLVARAALRAFLAQGGKDE